MVFSRRQLDPDHDAGDPVSPGDVDADIRDEIEFHLDALQRDIEREGVGADEVVEEVRRRFGDSERYADACRRIARKEVFMMQKINYMIMGVMAAIILLLGIRAIVSYQHEVELRREAEAQRARAEAVNEFLTDVLTSADPHEARTISVRELLDEAEQSIEMRFDQHPEVEARLREAIREAREVIELEQAGESDEVEDSADGA